MSFEKAHKHEQAGKEYWRNGEFVEAGECYTAAAYNYFADWPPSYRGKNTSHGEYYLLLAATCYRRSGRIDRARNRCQQGILTAEELVNRTKNIGGDSAYDRARYAVWYEYIGDFHVIGSLNDETDAYERAKRIYSEEGDPPLAHREQEHIWLVEFFRYLACEVEYRVDSWTEFVQEATFSEWVEYKQKCLPEILNIMESQESG